MKTVALSACLFLLGGCRFALSIGLHAPNGSLDAASDIAADEPVDSALEASPDVLADTFDAGSDVTTSDALDDADVADVPVVLREPLTTVALGAAFSCGRADSGVAWCWGANALGAFGNGTMADSLRPTNGFAGVTGVRRIAVGAAHACVVGDDGRIRCAGANADGQLGDGTQVDRAAATTIASLTGVQEIAAGDGHTCVVVAPGAVHCWGRNDRGQLGDGTMTRRSAPTPVAVMDAVHIAAGSAHTCVTRMAGSVSCWGEGFGASPMIVAGVADAAQIAAGRCHSCVVSTTGRLSCWGCNTEGQLGDGTTTDRAAPVDVLGVGTVLQVVARERHTCARTTDTVNCWGDGAMGQLGNGDRTPRTRATAPSGLTRAATSDLATGTGHTCAVLADRALWCWGANASGQLGDGTTTDRLTPTRIVP